MGFSAEGLLKLDFQAAPLSICQYLQMIVISVPLSLALLWASCVFCSLVRAGWNDIGYISTDISQATPHMTALAEKGIKLTHYYTQPSCTPSRVALMTGKFPYKNGFQNYELQVTDQTGVPLSNKLMPAYMKELGYRTVMYGKWNIGHCNSKYLPHERGFDHFVGYVCPGHGYSDYTCGMGSGVRDMIQGEAVPSDSSVAGTGATSAANITYSWSTGEEYLGVYDTQLYRDKTVAVAKFCSA